MSDPQLCSLGEYITYSELRRGIVRLSSPIDDLNIGDLLGQLAFANNYPPITLEIISPGGEIYSAMALYDVLCNYGNVTGLVRGYAASAAAMIVLQGCARRLATPSARLLIHEPQMINYHSVTKVTNLEDDTRELQTLQSVIFDILAARTHKSKADLKQFVERHEHWLSATEALDFGLIDAIVLPSILPSA